MIIIMIIIIFRVVLRLFGVVDVFGIVLVVVFGIVVLLQLLLLLLTFSTGVTYYTPEQLFLGYPAPTPSQVRADCILLNGEDYHCYLYCYSSLAPFFCWKSFLIFACDHFCDAFRTLIS